MHTAPLTLHSDHTHISLNGHDWLQNTDDQHLLATYNHFRSMGKNLRIMLIVMNMMVQCEGMLIMRVILIMLFLSLLGFATETMAGPSCTRIERKTSEKIVNDYAVQFFSLDCKEDIQLYRDEIAGIVKITDNNGKILEERIGGWSYEGSWYPPSEIKLAVVPNGFPYLVFHSSNYSSANISHSYILYSTTPLLQKYGEINSPVNEYQVVDRQGSEDIVVGFYKSEDGDYLIDRIVPDDKIAECNSCQGYNIEVLMITKDGLVIIDKHPYDFEKEQESYKKRNAP